MIDIHAYIGKIIDEWYFSDILPEALICKPFSVSGMIIFSVVRYFTMSLSFLMTLTISVRLQKLQAHDYTLIHLSGHFLKPWIWMFVAWKYCREEDKRRINLVRKIFFAHFEANEKILYKAAKISAQEALKKQLENK